MKADFKLNKSICDTKFIVYFRGHNGDQGHKGQKLSVFFPQEHARRSRGEFVRENALTPVVIGGYAFHLNSKVLFPVIPLINPVISIKF